MTEKLPRELRGMKTIARSPKQIKKAVRKIVIEDVKKRGKDILGAKKMKDGGLAEAIEKVKAKEMKDGGLAASVKKIKGMTPELQEKIERLMREMNMMSPRIKPVKKKDGGGVKMGPKIPAKIKDPVKVKPIPKKIAKKLVGFEKGGEAVPSRFKGFSKLPEEVQKKMDPALAERFEDGGAVKMGSGGGVCKGMGIARAGGKFKIR